MAKTLRQHALRSILALRPSTRCCGRGMPAGTSHQLETPLCSFCTAVTYPTLDCCALSLFSCCRTCVAAGLSVPVVPAALPPARTLLPNVSVLRRGLQIFHGQ